MRKRQRDYIVNLCNEFDKEASEGTRVFIMARENLRVKMSWKQEDNLEEKTKDNKDKMEIIINKLLEIL